MVFTKLPNTNLLKCNDFKNLIEGNTNGQEDKKTTWNVKTMLKAERMEKVAGVMLIYKIGVLALQEVKWKREGRIDKKKSTFNKGGKSKKDANGTGFMYRENTESR